MQKNVKYCTCYALKPSTRSGCNTVLNHGAVNCHNVELNFKKKDGNILQK